MKTRNKHFINNVDKEDKISLKELGLSGKPTFKNSIPIRANVDKDDKIFLKELGPAAGPNFKNSIPIGKVYSSIKYSDIKKALLNNVDKDDKIFLKELGGPGSPTFKNSIPIGKVYSSLGNPKRHPLFRELYLKREFER